jgi:hypothetical protein
MSFTESVRNCAAACLLAGSASFAGDTAQKNLEISGYASFEAGEIVKGLSSVVAEHPEIERAWLETGYVGLCVGAAVSPRLRVLVAGEAQPVISFRRTEAKMNDEWTEARQARTVFAIKHGEALYAAGGVDRPRFEAQAGFFPYKYDGDVRNLGEYLFRTYCYPPSMVNLFDKPYADLVGFRIGHSFSCGPGRFHHDLLFTTSTNFWPFMNWSPTYLADYSVERLFLFGAGAQWWNLFKVGVDGPGDAVAPNGGPFTFAGTKLMGRFSFDAKGLFPNDGPLAERLGREDLKLYGEAAVLGLKDYPNPDTSVHNGYDKVSWRLPVMLGINLPAFKLLDLLAIELEFQDGPYPNSVFKPFYYMAPEPAGQTAHANYKWSIYAKKNLGRHVGLIFQAARDHIMPLSTVVAIDFSDYTDVLLRDTDWWWTGKMLFDF